MIARVLPVGLVFGLVFGFASTASAQKQQLKKIKPKVGIAAPAQTPAKGQPAPAFSGVILPNPLNPFLNPQYTNNYWNSLQNSFQNQYYMPYQQYPQYSYPYSQSYPYWQQQYPRWQWPY